ncbi:Ubiquinol-cytochrome C reductase hinge protein [Opisthorchis viverrini]|uniref:Uncharacterized protein n=2 Tax=Opisthorchis viverrini TaxID=6198 RepID=A0A075A0G9_OPIVI|nr:hypothetical protein T265_02102 [Opisthorchis viverrini]KER31737.1 hypothetical protein T265_02102 [Opisthorchis viverrini]OON23232.1 Ubiquinol-cytochrome C reductase hinge protein [Opisthorchis viverrini]
MPRLPRLPAVLHLPAPPCFKVMNGQSEGWVLLHSPCLIRVHLCGVMSNGDLVDPINLLREKAQNSSKCRPFVEKLQACGERQPKTKESCEEEFIDLLECSDAIVASQIFKVLK